MLEIRFECLRGSARVYSRRDAEAVILQAGEAVTLPCADVPDDVAERTPEEVIAWIKDNLVSAWNAPGIGANGRQPGEVEARATGGGVIVREYFDVNAFLEPDAPDHRDYAVGGRNVVVADTIGGNVVTLLAVRPV